MSAWIACTLAAAFFQNLRFMLQKHLTARLSTEGVTLARFLYAAPFAALFLLAVLWWEGTAMPQITPRFIGFAIMGGLAQIVATGLLIALFSLKNFAVGVTLSKTETVSTVLASAVILGEFVPPLAFVAMLITAIGVIIMSGLPSRAALFTGILGRPALIGLASGAIFSLASIGYRGAALGLGDGSVLARSICTLALVTAFQALITGLWTWWRDPPEVAAVLRAWRLAVWLGLLSMLGSAGWFTAFTLQNAAYVKAVGQVELVFTLLASVFFFKERISSAELIGIALVVAGIVMLVLV